MTLHLIGQAGYTVLYIVDPSPFNLSLEPAFLPINVNWYHPTATVLSTIVISPSPLATVFSRVSPHFAWKRNESENERSEIAKKRLVSLVSL